jgi:hypothetical protein
MGGSAQYYGTSTIDIKVSHIDTPVINKVLELFKGACGKEAPSTITHGKVHKYLGMTIDYQVKGNVKITMIQYIKNLLAEVPNNMAGEAATPAASHLFQVNEEAKKLDKATG